MEIQGSPRVWKKRSQLIFLRWLHFRSPCLQDQAIEEKLPFYLGMQRQREKYITQHCFIFLSSGNWCFSLSSENDIGFSPLWNSSSLQQHLQHLSFSIVNRVDSNHRPGLQKREPGRLLHVRIAMTNVCYVLPRRFTSEGLAHRCVCESAQR